MHVLMPSSVEFKKKIPKKYKEMYNRGICMSLEWALSVNG